MNLANNRWRHWLVRASKRHPSKREVFSILCHFIMERLTNEQRLQIVVRFSVLEPNLVMSKMTEYFSFDQLHRCCGDTNAMTLNEEHYGNKPSFNNKKFTIAAILGLKNEINSKEKQYKERRNQYTSQKKNRSKRVRTIFTPEQLERLEAEFERQQYMVGPERLYLAHALHLTEGQVKVWFQNRRIKWRKRYVELTHQRLAALKEQRKINREEKSETNEAM